MRYRYASDERGRVVDVSSLDRNLYLRAGSLRCVGCGDQVVAVLGSRKERHFRHKSANHRLCSCETYLHGLAKKFIAEGFASALAAGAPYPLILPVPQVCRKWEKEFGFVCDRKVGTTVFDLTRHFDTVQVEGRIGAFVSDVLLSSSRTGEALLIEILVSHECTPEKIGSGLRIIEIAIQDEHDIDRVRLGIDTRLGWVKTHNLKPQPAKEDPCNYSCRRQLAAFHVFESGKSFIQTGLPRQIAAVRRSAKTVHTEIINEADHGIVTPLLATGLFYRDLAAKAVQAGAPIKCCALCRYAGFHAVEKPIFCKADRREVGVNAAATCAKYRPQPSRT